MKRYAITFEIYTSNPLTGERGWQIKFVTVVNVDGSEHATELIKQYPHFDCVILTQAAESMQDDKRFLEAYANNVQFITYDSYTEFSNRNI